MAATPGRNAARQAKKLKEIRKVRGAIIWHEKQRKKRQELAEERFEAKQAVLSLNKYKHEQVTLVRRKALKNAREDWQLGSLRPNRAVGEGSDKYGAMTAVQMQKPETPKKVQKHRNEVRAKKGLDLEYPLIVDDERYFHIVKDDRVMILRGKDKGKIGTISGIVSSSQQVLVKDLNRSYVDSAMFNAAAEAQGPKIETSMPVNYDDVRLVIPYVFTRNGQRECTDVVVDKIIMEQHSTGIDPFTGVDHGDAEIPKDHRYDPQTGLPIFHRYIAGTRHRIEWPWEMDQDTQESKTIAENPEDNRSWLSTIRHPITSLKTWRERSKTEKAAPTDFETEVATKLQEIEKRDQEKQKIMRPRSNDVELDDPYDVDTTRNIVEGADSMSYTLIDPPFPDTLGDELRSEIRMHNAELRKDPDAPRRRIKSRIVSQQSLVAQELMKKRQKAAQKMKTPMQLRWELEQAKKAESQKKNPLVETDALLMALGQHMETNGVKLPKSRLEELD